MTYEGEILLCGLEIGFALGSILLGALCWQIGWFNGVSHGVKDSHSTLRE